MRNADREPIVIAIPPSQRRDGQVSRYHKRRTTLDAETRAAIPEQKTCGKALRELAAMYGVSHQTISNVVIDMADSEAA